ncbi:TPA: Lar family restriction alleviation protein [Pseudomonas aeruginosa]
MAEELKPCPFCGCSMRLESNRDWHRIVGDHALECAFTDSETMVVPATKEQRDIAVSDWNARAVPAGHVVVSEGLLRRVCAEQLATCCMDDEMSWRRDRDSALIELHALLSEQDGGKP